MSGVNGWLTSLSEYIGGMSDELDDVKAENAKLRELVKHLRECTKHNTCAACDYAEDACDFDYDLRELGIEAD